MSLATGAAAETSSRIRTPLLLVLALLSTTGPFATDLYLPAFPQIKTDLGTDATGVQLTLTAFMIGIALGQLSFGALSDRFGRVRPLLVGATVSILASIFAAVAPTLALLVAARFVQGFSAAAGIVIARAIVSDLAAGPASARVFSLMMTVSGIAPVIAPFVGSLLVESLGWRGVFWTLAGLFLLMLASVLAVIRETHPPHRRGTGTGLGQLLRVFREGRFVGYVLLFASSFGVLMGYISASPFIYQNMMGLSPVQYGIMFGVNALGLTIAGTISAKVAHRAGPRRMLRAAVPTMLGMALALLAMVLLGVPPLLLAVPIFGAVSTIGFIMGNTTSLALSEVRHVAGSGSAVLGGTQFLLGAMVSPLVGLAGDRSALPLAIVMVASATLALAALIATRERTQA